MTVGKFKEILKQYNVPDDCVMQSDCESELNWSDMDCILFNPLTNTIRFKIGYGLDEVRRYEGWLLIYNPSLDGGIQPEELKWEENILREAYGLYLDWDRKIRSLEKF